MLVRDSDAGADYDYDLRPWHSSWQEAVHRLTEQGLGAVEKRKHRAAVRLRLGQSRMEAYSHVAVSCSGQHVLGSVEVYPVCLLPDTCAVSGVVAPLLGPLVVDPVQRGNGVGRALVKRAIESVSAEFSQIFCVGDPGYYAVLGFVPAYAHGVTVDPDLGEVAPLLLLSCSIGHRNDNASPDSGSSGVLTPMPP